MYWGAGGGQKSLGYYCESGAADIILLAFLNNYNKNSASFNFGNACGGKTCPQIEADIKTCQALGIKIILSFGGDDRRGKYGLKNDAQGESLADVIYDMFHPDGKAKDKPFGTAEIDGMDFDIENHNDKGLAALVIKLRKLWTTKTLIMSAVPQCPYPDKNVLNLLKDKDAKIDIAFIQFYNNGCSLKSENNFKKSWKQWEDFQTTLAGNSNLKLYIGLSATTSSSYTRPAADVDLRSADARTFSAFAGYFLWDAVSAFENIDKTTGINYAFNIRNILFPNEKFITSTVTSASTYSTMKTISSKKPTTIVTTSTSLSSTTAVETQVYVVPTTTISTTAGQSSTTLDDVQKKNLVAPTTSNSTFASTSIKAQDNDVSLTTSKSIASADDGQRKNIALSTTSTSTSSSSVSTTSSSTSSSSTTSSSTSSVSTTTTTTVADPLNIQRKNLVLSASSSSSTSSSTSSQKHHAKTSTSTSTNSLLQDKDVTTRDTSLSTVYIGQVTSSTA